MPRRKAEERIGIMQLKNIKEFTTQWKAELKADIAKLPKAPTFLIIQVGNNEASNRYVRNKIKDCEEVGIDAHCIKLEENVTTQDIQEILVKNYMADPDMCMMVQLPLPAHIDLNGVIAAIPMHGDVDGMIKNSIYTPCTPLGIMKYLEHCEFDLDGKNVVICGRSDIVGKPLAKMMTDKNATVSLLHSHTKNHWKYYELADLIVTAVGQPAFLNCYPIHVPVIDVGINFVDDKLVGDCINTENRDVTPVPGGVGLLTRCALLQNIVNAARWLR